jgi:hypothetical protein
VCVNNELVSDHVQHVLLSFGPRLSPLLPVPASVSWPCVQKMFRSTRKRGLANRNGRQQIAFRSNYLSVCVCPCLSIDISFNFSLCVDIVFNRQNGPYFSVKFRFILYQTKARSKLYIFSFEFIFIRRIVRPPVNENWSAVGALFRFLVKLRPNTLLDRVELKRLLKVPFNSYRSMCDFI